jgi:hypothetical protein
MSSEKQHEANRRNGALGKGHKTARGRNMARFNAVQSGHTAKIFTHHPRDDAAYQKHRQKFLLRNPRPRDPFEEMSLERCVRLTWLQKEADEMPAKFAEYMRDQLHDFMTRNPGACFEGSELSEKLMALMRKRLEFLMKYAACSKELQKQLIAERSVGTVGNDSDPHEEN